jgi:hypothetical protein
LRTRYLKNDKIAGNFAWAHMAAKAQPTKPNARRHVVHAHVGRNDNKPNAISKPTYGKE